MMNQNLEWTTNLGNAYYNQPQDVMQTVQVLRRRAEQAGNLGSTPQETVSNDQGYIELAPANPQYVYLPAYNPWAVYGQPVAPYPGFSLLGSLGSFLGAGPVRYGMGFAMSAFEHTPWGWMGWGLSWLTQSVLFQHSNYFTQSTTVADWGLPRGGPRAFRDRQPAAGFAGRGYRGSQSYNRPGGGYDQAAGQSFARPALPQQAYNRLPAAPVRPQPYQSRPQPYANRSDAYARPGYGYGSSSRPAQNYAARPGMAYASPYQSYRAPERSFPRAYAEAPQRGFAGESAKPERSGGFHLFGHGRDSGGFTGGRAPKDFYGGRHGPKSFGHGKAPKAGHFGGHKSSGHFR
jgi:hypothetical protein